jgi:hypothetical protein
MIAPWIVPAALAGYLLVGLTAARLLGLTVSLPHKDAGAPLDTAARMSHPRGDSNEHAGF